GLALAGIETFDHVFIQCRFPHQAIDVETTNQYGFDPGNKKNVLDQFGKVTGFTYVPAKDYHKRKTIDFKKIYFLAYQNLVTFASQKKQYQKAAHIAYMIKMGRNDEKGDTLFQQSLDNYFAYFFNQKQFLAGLNFINACIDEFGFVNGFKEKRYSFLSGLVNQFHDFEKGNQMEKYLVQQNNLYGQIKDDKAFSDIFSFFIFRWVEYLNSKLAFELSLQKIAELNEKVDHPGTIKLFENTLYHIQEHYDKKLKKYDETERLMEIAIKKLNSYQSSIKKFQKYHFVNQINDLSERSQYSEAIKMCQTALLQFNQDDFIQQILRDLYVKYSLFFYNKKDLENVIKVSEEGLAQFPQDYTLSNNYQAFLNNFLTMAINENNLPRARKIVNQALLKFPKNSHFIKVDQFLLSKNY
ncbi:MAG: hypothetical protein MJB14_03340, partial [Spirochaetes bacterium]|nr:hypothetical protein [Spirochaetota bacterium]